MASIPVNGEALRVIRERSGLSKKALAEKAGVDPSYLTLLEAGRRDPSASVVWRLSNALQIPITAIQREEAV